MTDPAPGQGGARALQLDGLRACAFLAVFLHHALGARLAWAGVDLFFVLSGYLITGILLRQRGRPGYYRAFYARRALRILPPYALVLLVVGGACRAEAGPEWVAYPLFACNVLEAFLARTVTALRPLWSLAVEEQFYVLWPAVVAALGRRGVERLSVALLVLAPASRAAWTLAGYTKPVGPVYHLLTSRLDLLAAGALLAALAAEPGRLDRLAARAPWLVGAALLAFAALAAADPGFRPTTFSLAFNTLGYSLVALVMLGVVAGALASATTRPWRAPCVTPPSSAWARSATRRTSGTSRSWRSWGGGASRARPRRRWLCR